MIKKTVVINFDIVISEKGELIFCEGGPGWGSVGYEGYQKISGKTMEESIIIALQKWHKTVQFIEYGYAAPYQQPRFTDLEIMRLPQNLPDINQEFHTYDRATFVKASRQIPPGIIVIGNPALPSQSKPYDLAELYHANGGNNPILNGHSDAYRLMVNKVMTMSLLKDIAPLLAKNTAIINLKHLAASDKDIAALQGEWLILKPNDGTRAFGIVVLPKKFLTATLAYLTGDDAGKNIPDYFKHANRKKLLEKLHELYKECHGLKGHMLIAQKYVPPLAIELSGKKYSATLRVVVAAGLDTASKQIELQYIGAFNK